MIDHLWQSTVFTTLAALLTVVLKKNQARPRYWIWLAASCKFLIPFSALIGIGTHLGWSPAPAVARPLAAFVVEELRGELGTRTTAVPAKKRPAELPIFPVLWIIGSAAVMGSILIRLRRAAAVVHDARVVREGREFDALRRLNGEIQLRCSTARIEPGLYGIWRPVLLLPEGIAERLSDSQLEAILSHEICHVRRRDNLAAAIHMCVETAFWFHPFVWWLGSRLVEERERACDEEVLRRGSEPQAYAESILKTCEFQLRRPTLHCVSGVTGADLKVRIEEIMTNRLDSRLGLGRTLLLATAGITTLAGPVAVGMANAPALRAQSVLTFEAASVKPSQPGLRGSGIPPVKNGNFRAMNVPLKDLMEEAFHLQNFQVSGGPGWISSDRFDVTAKADAKVSMAQIRQMLQTLLEERFKLVVRHESREMPLYALAVGKNGVKMKWSENGDCPETPVLDHPCGGFRIRQRRQIIGEKIPMESLADILSTLLGRTVVDRTGLKGYFDVNLEWSPEEGQFGGFGKEPEGAASESNGPSVFTAVQEQLGLKLESTKGPVEILVVSHAEKPSAN